jgi:hypothetical protein
MLKIACHIGSKGATPAPEVLSNERIFWHVHRESGWQVGAWAGFVCVLLSANGLAHGSNDQASIFFGGALLFFLWAAWARVGR